MITLPHRPRPPAAVPLTALVDVLLILLIFFMVTSTYLHLNMIPMLETVETPATASDGGGGEPAAAPLVVRLDASGAASIPGEAPGALGAALERRLAARPNTALVILPSPRAPLQALVDLLDEARVAGAARIQVVRLDRAGAP